MKLNKFENRDSLFSAIAKTIQHKLSESINKNNSASFIVPGGTTPAPAFKILSESDLDWQKVSIAQSDERWLEPTHKQSNERLTRENLLINNARFANYISMKNQATNIEDGQQACENAYSKIPNPFTVCMLGMGLDGHIASLFPDSKQIDKVLSLQNKDLCTPIDATGCSVAGDYPERMSLTLSAILNSETILLLITGNEKLNIVVNALNKEPRNDLPVSHILNQSLADIQVFWSE